MQMSAAIEMIWKLAAQEAVAAGFLVIEPEHFVEAILKFAEIPVEQSNRLRGPTAELAVQVKAIRKELLGSGIDTTWARRQLRTELGSGGKIYVGGVLHRSDGAKRLFDRASRVAKDARAETLLVEHLLTAALSDPSPTVHRVLGDTSAVPDAPGKCTPLLDRHGIAFGHSPAAESTGRVDDFGPESRVLLEELGSGGAHGIFLVAESETAARKVVEVVAAGGPPEKGFRILCVEDAAPLEELLREVARDDEAVVFLPRFEALSDPSLLLPDLRARPPCRAWWICRVSPATYQGTLRSNRAWRKRTRAIWLRAAPVDGLPDEL